MTGYTFEIRTVIAHALFRIVPGKWGVIVRVRREEVYGEVRGKKSSGYASGRRSEDVASPAGSSLVATTENKKDIEKT